MTKISCILPVYNGEAFLAEAIDSILKQTAADLELIIVNDGSVDRSLDIAESYRSSDPRVVVITKANGGIVSALNLGLAAAKGEYIARMDADDISLPHRFAFQSNYLDKHPDVVLVGGMAQGFSEAGILGGLTNGGRHTSTDLTAFPPRVAVSVHPLIMVRKSAMDAVGRYRELFPHAEDYDLFIRLSKIGRLVNPAELVLYYRRHNEAVSIKYLPAQERAAALAEACGLLERRSGKQLCADANTEEIARSIWGQPLLDSYTAFRIWRRLGGPLSWSDTSILKHLFRCDLSSLVSKSYFRLRIYILAYFIKSRVQSLREA